MIKSQEEIKTMEKIKGCFDCKDMKCSEGKGVCTKYSVIVMKGRCPTDDYLVCLGVEKK